VTDAVERANQPGNPALDRPLVFRDPKESKKLIAQMNEQ